MHIRNRIFLIFLLFNIIVATFTYVALRFGSTLEPLYLAAAGTLLALLVAFAQTSYIKNSFKKPQETLNKKLAELTSRKIEEYVPNKYPQDEFTELYKSIDKIAINLKQYKEEINAKIQEKNTEISEINKKLQVQEGAAVKVFQELETIDRMKTEFISLASHQLRTPLVSIKWGLEALKKNELGQLTDKQQEYVHNIYNSNNRMIALINGLLNVSRIESGRFMIEPKPTSLAELAQDVINEVKPKALEKNHKILLQAQENLPQINIDPNLVRHAYANLLSNAIKYSPPNSEIKVQIAQNGEELLSSVTDQGYGIPDKEKEKIFRKFFRADNVRKIDADGTGLGLYLVKAIVEALGGIIWFESAENKGTTFWFSLPLKGVTAKKGEVSIV